MLFDQEFKLQGVPTYPIRRFYEKESKGIKTFIDIHYLKVESYSIYIDATIIILLQLNVMIIHPSKSVKMVTTETLLIPIRQHQKGFFNNIFELYFSKKKSIEALKNRIFKILTENIDIKAHIAAPLYANFSKSHIKLWKCDIKQKYVINEQLARYS